MAEYVVNIIIDDKTSQSGTTLGGADKPTAISHSATGQPTEQEQTTVGSIVAKIGKSAAVGYALKVVDNIVTNQVNRISLSTGHRLYEERVNFAYSTAKQGVSMLGSIAIGAATGGAAGALIGAVVSVASTAISYANQSYNLSLQQSLDNVSIKQANIRAGAFGSR